MRLYLVVPAGLVTLLLALSTHAIGQVGTFPTPSVLLSSRIGQSPSPTGVPPTPSTANASPATTSADRICTGSSKPAKFAQDPFANAAAIALINQMVQFAKANTKPDISPQALAFNLAIVSAAANCTGKVEADARTAFKAEAATNNSDKQNGAPAASSGTTSATEKPGIPSLLGIAVENGSISNNINGTTMTLSSTIFGLVSGFGKDTQTFYNRCSVCVRTGFSATFNIADTSDPLASATRRQISQWQVKYTFRDRSERSKDATKIYNKTLLASSERIAKSLAAPILDNMNKWLDESVNDPSSPLSKAMAETKTDLSSQNTTTAWLTDAQVTAAAANLLTSLEQNNSYQNLIVEAVNKPDTLATAAQYATAVADYVKSDTIFETQIKDLQKGWNESLVFSQQYPSTTTTIGTTTTTPPTYFVAELDISYQPGARDLPAGQTPTLDWRPSITANFNGSVYPNPLVKLNEQVFRGGVAALSSAWNLGSGPFIKNPLDKSQLSITLSGKYTRLQENQHQPGKKADIALGNLKLEIPFGSGLSLPLSVTVANADQQIKETYVRGSFGISFDLDKLSALLTAKN